MSMAAGDSTLVTRMAQHRVSRANAETGEEQIEEGALAVLERRDGQWVETAFLTIPGSEGNDLGRYIATDDNTIIASLGAGTHPEDVAVFEREDGEWALTQILEGVGCVVGMDVDDDVAVFADCCPEPDASEGEVSVGRAHVFRRSDGHWAKAQELRTSVKDQSNRMGSRFAGKPIALDDGALVMGVPFYTEPGSRDYESGLAFVFQGSATSFREAWILEPQYPEEGGHFGDSVALHEDQMAISAIGENSFEGRVYVHSRQSGWSRVAAVTPENTRGLLGFGWSIAIRDDRLLVGTPLERGQQSGINHYEWIDSDGSPYGAAYLFGTERSGNRALQELFYLKDARPPNWGDGFGAAVALTDGQVVVAGTGRSSPGFLHVWGGY
jgi:hypothetical protein